MKKKTIYTLYYKIKIKIVLTSCRKLELKKKKHVVLQIVIVHVTQ
jgi:hypothetical protein